MAMTETMIDLQAFCATAPYRSYLHKPFTRGDWTYATNGHIAVRVPALPHYDDTEGASTIHTFFDVHANATWRPLGHAILPEAGLVECDACRGRGREHDCPDCSCMCEACDGTGMRKAVVSVELRGLGDVNATYAALLLALPGIEVAPIVADLGAIAIPAIAFRFSGGVGVLMPLRGTRDVHLDVVL